MLTDEQVIEAMHNYDKNEDHVGGMIKFARAIETAARAQALEDAAEICENESSSYDVAIDAMNGCAEKIRLFAEKEQTK